RLFLFSSCSRLHRDLPSFPTRRSSDLDACLSTEGVYCSRCVYYGKHQSFQATAGFRDYAPNAYSSSNGNLLLLGKIGVFHNRRNASRDRKSGSAGMPRPISYAVFCLKKKSWHSCCSVVISLTLSLSLSSFPPASYSWKFTLCSLIC